MPAMVWGCPGRPDPPRTRGAPRRRQAFPDRRREVRLYNVAGRSIRAPHEHASHMRSGSPREAGGQCAARAALVEERPEVAAEVVVVGDCHRSAQKLRWHAA